MAKVVMRSPPYLLLQAFNHTPWIVIRIDDLAIIDGHIFTRRVP